MFVNTEQLQMGVTQFIENELAAKAVGMNKFLLYFSLPLVHKQIAHYVSSFSANPLTAEMFDKNHNVDLDLLYSMAKNAVQKSGQFVAYNIVFSESDIDKLYTYIQKTAGGTA